MPSTPRGPRGGSRWISPCIPISGQGFGGEQPGMRDELERVTRTLAALPEPPMRVQVLGERLRALAASDAASLLEAVADRLASGDPNLQPFGAVFLDLPALRAVVGSIVWDQIREILEARGARSPLRLIHERDGQDAPRPPAERPLPEEPVGLRIAMARRPSSRTIDRLLTDPDPRVLRTLLSNPRLTENELLKLATSPLCPVEVLEAIARDARWGARYRVRLALVNNERTPLRVVAAILPSLMQQDLWEIWQAGRAPAGVRLQAKMLLRLRESPVGVDGR